MNIDAILASKGRGVLTVSANTTVGEAMRKMSTERVSALVISEDGAMIDGIVSDRGLMNVLVAQGIGVLERPLGDVMTREVFTCSRGDSVGAIMAAMTDRRIRHIPVVEQDGRLCGLVSIGDVVKHHVDEIQREATELREYISGNV
jgi:signal-transduction protein with cAMP-binding, CBS, and nucleotidyltransferase domain